MLRSSEFYFNSVNDFFLYVFENHLQDKIIKLNFNKSCELCLKLTSHMYFIDHEFKPNQNSLLSYIKLYFDEEGTHMAGNLSFSDREFILHSKESRSEMYVTLNILAYSIRKRKSNYPTDKILGRGVRTIQVLEYIAYSCGFDLIKLTDTAIISNCDVPYSIISLIAGRGTFYEKYGYTMVQDEKNLELYNEVARLLKLYKKAYPKLIKQAEEYLNSKIRDCEEYNVTFKELINAQNLTLTFSQIEYEKILNENTVKNMNELIIYC